ncbi:hypothetical protein NUW58_g9222 [Xylaria curta]|uniref:Uncharacterized protein n=1 Tax=Xylaria curta TaxID=42375 RepID=A0ACC1MZ38_9PEZI|nr:hypothetical protein NUW58_g9222 [Xylaria curta]
MSSPSPEQIADMMAHASDDQRPSIIACVSISAFLATIIVGARLFARLIQGNVLLIADYLISFALCLFIPYCVALALATDSGLGKHVIFVTDLRLLQIYFISSEVIYSVVIVSVKWSILAFYRRIFPQRWFHLALLGVAVFMGAWMFTTVFAIIFQCLPIEFNWDQTIESGHCIAIGQFALVTSILNVVTDVSILVLPLPLVWELNVTPRRRWTLSVLFALGGGACVVGITRAAWIGRLNATVDPTWDNVTAVYLSTIEVLVGFLVSSIPSYPVLFHRITGNINTSKQSDLSSDKNKRALGRNIGPDRRHVPSWNRITDTDDIELVSQA